MAKTVKEVSKTVQVFEDGNCIGQYEVPDRCTSWKSFLAWLKRLKRIVVHGTSYFINSYCAQCGHIEVRKSSKKEK